MNVIDLDEARRSREQPDPEHVRTDQYGRPVYRHSLSYDVGERVFTVDVWAYDLDDAKAHLEGLRASVRYEGQIYSTVEA